MKFSGKIKNIGNGLLLAMMLLSVYNHYMVEDPLERTGPALVFTFMLTGRMVVWYQIHRKEVQELAALSGIKQD